jgi:hypothetical protein
MNTQRLAALVLIVSGALALAYGGFSYTRDTHAVDLGPVQVQVQERSYLSVPIWAGVASLVAGLILLGTGVRRAR